jgi:5-methylcytosine-specific restriction protein B
MTNEQLAAELKNACERAGKGEHVTTVHCFGIRFANELKGRNLKEIAGLAGIKESLGTEINKGVRLARHVQLIEG